MAMGLSIREKLSGEIFRFLNRDFVDAVMSACALIAYADKKVRISERYQIDKIISNDPTLTQFDPEAAGDRLDDALEDLKANGEVGKARLQAKVAKLRGHPKRTRTLLRAAYLIITADGEIAEAEEIEFVNLCVLLDQDATKVWQELKRQG